MTKKLRVAIAQLNLLIGDISENVAKLIQAAHYARDTLKADVVVYPELCITGYPPEDLLLRKTFLDDAVKGLNEFKSAVTNIHCLISYPHVTPNGLMNSCVMVYNNAVLAHYNKQNLPNYGVFDEKRYFIPGNSPCIVSIKDIPIGLVICEDAWFPEPIQQAANAGAKLILTPNASPFEIDKQDKRYSVLSKRAISSQIPIVYVNNIGGQDDLIFDGGSMVIDAKGKICQHAGFFKENILAFDIDFSQTETLIESTVIHYPSSEEKIYNALVLGVRDYVNKNNFPGVLIGVSGGIDSALTLSIAVDALGKDRVRAVLLPSQYTSEKSMKDAFALIKNMDVKYDLISIETTVETLLNALKLDDTTSLTAQNIQSRARTIMLMALSNESGYLVLTTSNRSEVAVGYTTLYGDMSGGFAVLKDVPKTLVYQLTHYRNKLSHVIPHSIIERPPTAELAPNQKDEDTLPPYPLLDQILELYLDQEQGIEEIIVRGFDPQIVKKVVEMIHRSEYKRRQAPIGVRINHKSFGRDYRYPITSGFKK